MMGAPTIPDAVLWHEGMLLSPQHFQQADLRAAGLRSYMLLAAAPYGWGVIRLRLDEAALIAGKLIVADLEAIMPDGLLVRHAGMPEAPKLELDLEHVPIAPGQRWIAVHLAVATHHAGAPQSGEQQRYRQEPGRAVADANTGEGGVTIPRLVPILSLHATAGPLVPPPPRFTSLPIAVLERDGQRFNMILFEPPRLRVSAGCALFQEASSVCADLLRKASDWGVRLSGALAEGSAGTVGESIGTLRAIIGGLPRLEALVKSEMAHPFEVYLALCDVAGHLAVAGGRLTLPVFAAYSHADPLAAFRQVAKFIEAALETLRTPNLSVTFEQVRPGCFNLLLQPEHFVGGTLVLGARTAPGQDPAMVRAWMEAAVIGSVARVQLMLISAVIGLPREG